MNFNKITTFITTVVAGFFSFFGLLAIPLLLLVPCQVVDWFTGIAVAKVKKEKVTSEKAFLGTAKKIGMYILIFVGFALDTLIIYITNTMNITFVLPSILACIVAVWLVLNELISITENIEVLGINVSLLSPIMKLIRDKVEETAKVEDIE